MFNSLQSLRAYAKQSRGSKQDRLWPLDRGSRFAPSRWHALIILNLISIFNIRFIKENEDDPLKYTDKSSGYVIARSVSDKVDPGAKGDIFLCCSWIALPSLRSEA